MLREREMTTDRVCRTRDCGRAIPSGQIFCRQCLGALPIDLRHTLLFGSLKEREAAAEKADRSLRKPATNEALERFRSARAFAAAAMETLERKK